MKREFDKHLNLNNNKQVYLFQVFSMGLFSFPFLVTVPRVTIRRQIIHEKFSNLIGHRTFFKRYILEMQCLVE